MGATQMKALADTALADVSPSRIAAAVLMVCRNQIVDAFVTALAEAVVDGAITVDCAAAINERAIAVFVQQR